MPNLKLILFYQNIVYRNLAIRESKIRPVNSGNPDQSAHNVQTDRDFTVYTGFYDP